MATQVGRRMFPRWHLCFDVYCGVKRHAVWGKTKTCLDWLRLCMCVCVLEMYLYMSVSVCDRGGGVCPCVGLYTVCVRMTETCVFIWKTVRVLCMWHSVHRTVCVFVAVSGDICCVVGWERSTVGRRSLRLRRWKLRSQPGPVGQDTLAHTTHKYKVTHANLKTYTQSAHTLITHTQQTYVSYTQQAGGHTSTQGRETKAKIKQLSRQNNM